MKAPHEFSRRILLCVTGLSPQIVTETLYALAHAQPAFIPTEVHLVTTLEGARLAKAALLHPDGGQFHALLSDYPQLGRPRFDEANIHVIAGPDGAALADIRTPAENACAADAITAVMARLTQDEDAALHVSIAGGRKTMGFYLGYAFSLYARPQDRLSHVLVSAPFESHPEFFFPPANPKRLTTRDNRHIDTAEALVTLAEIPVVLLRHGLPQGLREGRAGYIETVSALNASFGPPRLEIDLAARQARCGGRVLELKPALLAWLAFWAQTALDGRPMRTWRDIDPAEFLRPYARVVGRDAVAFEAAQRRLKDGMEKEFFEQNNSKLESALKAALGPAAAPYLLARAGRKPHTQRGLALPAEAIALI
ncbi:MAG: CRISPR-associated ring nuclease Csm6 [Rhodocyclaceae bacterium]|nr:CRISPR-associated ring nuclease Csm6 [Rhodocyclaceae bacterium]